MNMNLPLALVTVPIIIWVVPTVVIRRGHCKSLEPHN
jgi:hypothetical protein